MKSLRKATRAWSTVAYQAITASKLAVFSTTCANFSGEVRSEAAGRVRPVSVATLVIAVLHGWVCHIVARRHRCRRLYSRPTRPVASFAHEVGQADTSAAVWGMGNEAHGQAA